MDMSNEFPCCHICLRIFKWFLWQEVWQAHSIWHKSFRLPARSEWCAQFKYPLLDLIKDHKFHFFWNFFGSEFSMATQQLVRLHWESQIQSYLNKLVQPELLKLIRCNGYGHKNNLRQNIPYDVCPGTKRCWWIWN